VIPTIRVAASAEEMAWMAAERFVKAAEDAIIATGRFAVALSGGSTPRQLYSVLANETVAGRIDWTKTHILFADERCVPADHPDSNFGMVCKTLLDRVPIPYENIHRMAGEKDPAEAADEYDRLLAEGFSRGLDLVLLGVGEEGHTASLFPGTEALGVTDRRCVQNYVPKLSAWRLTLTASYINQAFEVMVLVAGKAKADIAQQALEGLVGPPRLPIQMIQPKSGRLTWVMDVEAAAMDQEEDVESGDGDIADGSEGLG
jgi:6-phosphogluconolactonase